MKLTFSLFILLAFGLSDNYLLAQKFKPVEEIPEGKALVYIYRPGNFVGSAMHYSININDEKVSEKHLRNKTYLVYFAEPGQHNFWFQNQKPPQSIDLALEAGKTYYVRSNCCALTIPETLKAEKEIVKCKLAVK